MRILYRYLTIFYDGIVNILRNKPTESLTLKILLTGIYFDVDLEHFAKFSWVKVEDGLQFFIEAISFYYYFIDPHLQIAIKALHIIILSER